MILATRIPRISLSKTPFPLLILPNRPSSTASCNREITFSSTVAKFRNLKRLSPMTETCEARGRKSGGRRWRGKRLQLHLVSVGRLDRLVRCSKIIVEVYKSQRLVFTAGVSLENHCPIQFFFKNTNLSNRHRTVLRTFPEHFIAEETNALRTTRRELHL